MPRASLFAIAAILACVLLLTACSGDDPATPPSVPEPPADDPGLDLAAVLAAYAAGDTDAYAAHLHDEFRFVPPEDGADRYPRDQELDLLAAMHAGEPDLEGAVLAGIAVTDLAPAGAWTPTDRDDPLAAHRLDAVKRTYTLTLTVTLDDATTRTVQGEVTAFADTAGTTPLLLGLVDHTGDAARADRPSWSDLRRTWAAPEQPDLPGTPDILSMRWITAHDGRDWLRMGELLHPDFRYVGPDGEVLDRAGELALFADLMAGRTGRADQRLAQLDVQDWEHTEGPWSPVDPDDPHFGHVPDAVWQWLSIRIVYTTTGGQEWVVDGLVRMVTAETGHGVQMLGFVDDSADTGEPGSVGWSLVREWYR